MSKWVRFKHRDVTAFGKLVGDQILVHEGNMFEQPSATGEQVALGDVELLTPVEPTKMVAMVNNFHALLDKLQMPVPKEPLYFFKANSSFLADGKTIKRPLGYDGKIIFEGELGLVIGKTCRNVSVSEAEDYLFGCTCVNDVTSFEILNRDPQFAQWTRCKAADTFGVMGPVVATGLDVGQLTIRAVLNDQERQNYPITDMIFTPAELISAISHDMTLLPGDVIACGTSVGVGTMRPGDRITIEIEGVCSLSNPFE
jgi:2-keto-4-pentenoate hydratase/2-oxohepta-3-ene-1,7-dioic acid hydratase in catechol pathway